MENMKKKSFMGKIVSMLAGLLYVILGILMIQNPNTTLATISLIMGWSITIAGASAVVYSIFYKTDFDEALDGKKVGLMEGLLLLILGLMFLFGNFINNTLILAYLLVFWIIMDSAMQLQLTFLIQKTGLRLLVMLLDILIIAYGIFLLFNPESAENFLVFYVGVGFVSTGVGKFLKSF